MVVTHPSPVHPRAYVPSYFRIIIVFNSGCFRDIKMYLETYTEGDLHACQQNMLVGGILVAIIFLIESHMMVLSLIISIFGWLFHLPWTPR